MDIKKAIEQLKNYGHHRWWPSGLHVDNCSGCCLNYEIDVILKEIAEQEAKRAAQPTIDTSMQRVRKRVRKLPPGNAA